VNPVERSVFWVTKNFRLLIIASQVTHATATPGGGLSTARWVQHTAGDDLGDRQSALRAMFVEARSLCRVRGKEKAAPHSESFQKTRSTGLRRQLPAFLFLSRSPACHPPLSSHLRDASTDTCVSQACKRCRLLKFFNPKQACCADCLAVGCGSENPITK
jgi:hypothetical protein